MQALRITSRNRWTPPNCSRCSAFGSIGKFYVMIANLQTVPFAMETDVTEILSAETPDSYQAKDRANILLVDDRQDKLLAMEAILDDLGQNMVKVSSGREALRCLLQRDFAVILLDVNMPGMDGFETAFFIRQRKSSEHTPIIFVTAISDTETHVSRGYSLGAVDYILAPVLPDVLRTKVSVFVELHKKTQQIRSLNEQLQKRIAQLTETNQAMEAITYSIAH